jgi:hypothetical protein
MAVVAVERGGQGGHFDISYNVAVAVLAELWWFEKCGGKKERKKKKEKKGGVWRQKGVDSGHGRWQWQCGSGTVGKRRSVRFEWYQLECGSGSIGRVVVV